MTELSLPPAGEQGGSPTIALDESLVELLFQVRSDRVFFTRGVYRLYETGQPNVSRGIQVLRAMHLVRLVELTNRDRIPPTRRAELTTKGEQVAAAYA